MKDDKTSMASGDPAFIPWVGSQYQTEGLDGVRLLILGEAQYAGNGILSVPKRGGKTAGDAQSTQLWVKELAITRPEKGRPFWTKVAKTVLGISAGIPITAEQRRSFWNRVAFYNYMQWWMPSGRQRPTAAMWEEAAMPFSRVVVDIKPELILILGSELSKRVPRVEAETVSIRHPASVGFSYSVWSDKVAQALEAVKRG